MKTQILRDESLLEVTGSGFNGYVRRSPDPKLVGAALHGVTKLAKSGLAAQSSMIDLFNKNMTTLIIGYSDGLGASQNLIAKLGSTRFPVGGVVLV